MLDIKQWGFNSDNKANTMARLVFFGTPDFAVVSLLSLKKFCDENNHELVAVITQPDQPQGRKQNLQACPVKIVAQDLGLLVLQPASLRKNTIDGDKFFVDFTNLKVDLAIVVAYGQIITQRLLDAASLGFVNIHASILPHLRGASPIQHALKEGLSTTGVCLMDMQLKLDAGDVFICQKAFILPKDTYETLSQRLSVIGADLLKNNLAKLLKKELIKYPQDEAKATYAPMIKKEDGLLDFNSYGKELQNKIRAHEPWPGSFAFINQKRVKFFDSFFLPTLFNNADFKPGEIISVNPYLAIKVKDGVVFFKAIQVEGKKILPIKEAILGFNIKIKMFINC